MKDCIVKVSKVQFDYWYEKGSLGEAVRMVGDVDVCVTKKNWEDFCQWKDRFGYHPTKILEIAMYENYMDIQKKFGWVEVEE
jgi:hypothetical protein